MTINITPEIKAAYDAYLDEPVDADFTGRTIRRRDTHPFVGSPASGIVDFAAGFQAAGTAGAAASAWLDEAMKLAEDYARAWQHDVDGSFVIKDQAVKAKEKLRAHLATNGVGEVHTDHPLRHYDRTCPACNADVTGSEIERLRAEQASNGVDGMSPPERFKWDQDDDDAAPYGLMVGPVPDGEWVRWRDVAHLYGVAIPQTGQETTR